MNPVTQPRFSFTKSRWQEGGRQRREGGKIEAGKMGRTEGRFGKSRLLALPHSTSSHSPSKEINKITPYGYDRMQMKSQRENTLIAAKSQNSNEKLCGASPPGAPPPAQRLCLHATPELQALRLPTSGHLEGHFGKMPQRQN